MLPRIPRWRGAAMGSRNRVAARFQEGVGTLPLSSFAAFILTIARARGVLSESFHGRGGAGDGHSPGSVPEPYRKGCRQCGRSRIRNHVQGCSESWFSGRPARNCAAKVSHTFAFCCGKRRGICFLRLHFRLLLGLVQCFQHIVEANVLPSKRQRDRRLGGGETLLGANRRADASLAPPLLKGVLHELFGFLSRELLLLDLGVEGDLLLRGELGDVLKVPARQCPRRIPPVLLLNGRAQLQERQQPGNFTLGLAREVRDFSLAVPLCVSELHECVGEVERMQVNALPVLHDLADENFAAIGCLDPARNLSEARGNRCVEAALPGDDLEDIFFLQIPDGNGLEDAQAADRFQQFPLCVGIKILAGLRGVWLQAFNGDEKCTGQAPPANVLAGIVGRPGIKRERRRGAAGSCGGL